MLFSSITFLFYFLPVALALHWALPRGWRNGFLLAASLFFYAWGEPAYVLLMGFSILFNYLAGRLVRGRGSLALAVGVNLALLGFFKYADFVVGNIRLLGAAGLEGPGLPLPIGISFYTFQAISYQVDAYRGVVSGRRGLVGFGAYISLFPQLIAGPIVRLSGIEGELGGRELSLEAFAAGVRLFVVGLGKKVLLANNIGLVWDYYAQADAGGLSVAGAWLGAVAFTFQIYFDFSGYSDMAVGLGRMLGFTFPRNFDYPYTARSVTEFWRRWHMSLSSFFRDYLYIPLGGNRKGLAAQLRNILCVWLLTGLWHGASWNFAAWGLYFGVLLIVEKLFLLRLLDGAPGWARRAYAMLLVVLSWVVFASESLSGAAAYLGAMFGLGGGAASGAVGTAGWLVDGRALYLLRSNLVLLAILCAGSTRLPAALGRALAGRGGARLGGTAADGRGGAWRATAGAVLEVLWHGGVFALSVAFLISSSFNPFLYFRF
ncbi:MAG: MBOAT family protein [Clostridiales Family XIII bacterium]|jgi:alginate O-acetyltransferase complex protein AlgI|nr:MBOAT family protein [Clostridiales Family XIII bacterium]